MSKKKTSNAQRPTPNVEISITYCGNPTPSERREISRLFGQLLGTLRLTELTKLNAFSERL